MKDITTNIPVAHEYVLKKEAQLLTGGNEMQRE